MKKQNKLSMIPFKIYTALLKQQGTSAPVLTERQNTLGHTPTSNYQIGYFEIHTQIPYNNLKIVMPGWFEADGNGIPMISCYNGTELLGKYKLFYFNNDGLVTIGLEFLNPLDEPCEISVVTQNLIPIELRVYP